MYNKRVVRRNRNKKLFIQILFVVILVFVLFSVVFATDSSDIKETKIITVKKGDTLWSISSKISNNTDIYILEVMNDIKKLNKMTDSNIYVGEELIVYIY